MLKRLRFLFLMAVLGLAWAVATPVGAQEVTDTSVPLAEMGVPIAPHGYPAYYEDSNGLQLELCLPLPAGYSTRSDLCVFDPLDEGTELVVTGEGFWWLAETSMVMPGGGDAELTLGLEATFGGDESAVNGNQISFGRTRIRIDTPVAGTYTVIHPFGTVVFEDVPAGTRGINYTADIGSTNFRDPATAFAGTLNSGIGPFLTWPGYDENVALQVRDPETDEILEQYVGDPNLASIMIDPANPETEYIFRVLGPDGIDVQTNLFFVMGKLFSNPPGYPDELAHVFPPVPDTNLHAVGPVNRVEPFNPAVDPDVFSLALQPDGLVTGVDNAYPVGYPLWYQENIGTPEEQVGGLQLTLCPPFDIMCIGDPINLNDEDQLELRTGGEQFWYLAEASFEDPSGNTYDVTLGIEATFGGNEAIQDGNQIAFGRERIRIDFENRNEPAATYRITHPYGQRILSSDPNDLRRIRFTADIGDASTFDPDNAFIGTLFSGIGPTFLTWPEYDNRDAEFLAANPEYLPLQRLLDPDNPETSPVIKYIGDPNTPMSVVGSPTGNNFFRVEKLISGTVESGTWQEVAYTEDFLVMGKRYEPETFAVYNLVPDALAPVAASLTVTLDLNEGQPSAVVDVLAAATNVVDPVDAITIVTPPLEGTAVVDLGAGTITYTPSVDFAVVGGVDQFNYTITAANGTSNIASVTITVIPVTPDEVVTVSKARLALNKLRWDLAGDSNMPGTILTVHAGPTTSGPIIGTATVANNGKWRLRATSTTNPNVTSISISSSTGEVFNNFPLDVR